MVADRDPRMAARASHRSDAGRVRLELLRALRRARRYLPGEARRPDAKAFRAYVDATAPTRISARHRSSTGGAGRHFYFGAADGEKADFMHFRRAEAITTQAGSARRRPSTMRSARRRSPRRASPGCGCFTISTAAIAVWPFDPVPEVGHVVVEIYTAIAARAAGLRKGLSKLRDGPGAGCRAGALGRTSRAAGPLQRPFDRRDPGRRLAPRLTQTGPNCGRRPA